MEADGAVEIVKNGTRPVGPVSHRSPELSLLTQGGLAASLT